MFDPLDQDRTRLDPVHSSEEREELRGMYTSSWDADVATDDDVRSVQAAAEAEVLSTCIQIEDRQRGCLVLPGMMAPQFQFDAAGRLLPIVSEINALIEADDDAWAAASWWISIDSHLGGRRPADLVMGNEEQLAELHAAARRYLAPTD